MILCLCGKERSTTVSVLEGKRRKKRSKINRQQKLYALWAGYLILVIHSLDAKIHDSASSDRPMQS